MLKMQCSIKHRKIASPRIARRGWGRKRQKKENILGARPFPTNSGGLSQSDHTLVGRKRRRSGEESRKKLKGEKKTEGDISKSQQHVLLVRYRVIPSFTGDGGHETREKKEKERDVLLGLFCRAAGEEEGPSGGS